MPGLCTNAFVKASKALGWDGQKCCLPTEQAVDRAVQEFDVYSLLKWTRYGHSPGALRIGQPDFEEVLEREVRVVDKIVAGLKIVKAWIEAQDED